ncbi:MAG: hypothetical protein RJA44_903 [Pseudomonadota bacterium]
MTAAFPVTLAAPARPDAPVRALVLPGGGLRLSYQAGMLLALEQAGLDFQIMDGTSGGSLNMSMLLCGLDLQDLCQRWRTLRWQDTVSMLPLRDYLKGSQLEALADADGFRDRVLPHLGIELARVRAASGVHASYNLLEYTSKSVESVAHTDIDADLLVAGLSLPGVFPPLRRGERIYLDTGFVQDANLMQAVRQGAEELWVLWGLGNSGVYRGDPLHLYVQMLEMSANTALNQQMAQIAELNQRIARGDSPHGQRRPIEVHLLRPEYPLPLDPELYLGQIEHATLIDMGYADARRYLAEMPPPAVSAGQGARINPGRMRDPVPGIRLRLDFSGTVVPDAATGPQPVELALCMHIADLDAFLADPSASARVTGHWRGWPAPSGAALPIHAGTWNHSHPSDDERLLEYRFELGHGAQSWLVLADQLLRDDAGFDLWRDLSTLRLQMQQPGTGAETELQGELRLHLPDLKAWLGCVHATETRTPAEALQTSARFAQYMLRELYAVYGWNG